MSDDTENVQMPTEDQLFAIVEDMLGANRIRARCSDGVERVCRIPGKMQKKVWIREDDLIIAEPWSWQDEKADVIHRYERSVKENLIEENELFQDQL